MIAISITHRRIYTNRMLLPNAKLLFRYLIRDIHLDIKFGGKHSINIVIATV